MIKKLKIITLTIFFFFPSHFIFAKETWILDKDLSSITFEIPIFLAPNVKGKFEEIEGLVEIDVEKKENNKAIFSVKIKSIKMNYNKYRDLLLSEIFFYESKFPLALIDTQLFTYENQKDLELLVEFSIKGIVLDVPLKLKIIHLTENLIQIKSDLNFSRTSYQVGTGIWSSTAILQDKVAIRTNLFLFRN